MSDTSVSKYQSVINLVQGYQVHQKRRCMIETLIKGGKNLFSFPASFLSLKGFLVRKGIRLDAKELEKLIK